VAAVPGDDQVHPVFVGWQDEQWLQDAVGLHRADQFGQISELAAWVVRVGGDECGGRLDQGRTNSFARGCGDGGGHGVVSPWVAWLRVSIQGRGVAVVTVPSQASRAAAPSALVIHAWPSSVARRCATA
jgi:hypothetical protein